MLVYDDVITRITVFCILFLLDDSQHQRNQTDTSDKHQQRYQQFTCIAQLRRQIQARSYRAKGGNTFKQRGIGISPPLSLLHICFSLNTTFVCLSKVGKVISLETLFTP